MIRAPFKLARLAASLACLAAATAPGVAQVATPADGIPMPRLKAETGLFTMPRERPGAETAAPAPATLSSDKPAPPPASTVAPAPTAPGASSGMRLRAPDNDARYKLTPSEPRITRCRELQPGELKDLTLMAAVEHVMCRSPAINQALMLVEEQKAAVDLAQTAFRPQYSASSELATNRIPSSNSGAGSLKSSATGSFGVSWTLYDAGVREANLAQTRQTLNSARAGQQVAVLNALNDTLRLYVEASTTYSRLVGLRETEDVAKQSLEAAKAKYDALVVSLSEKLQAETALAQATLERVRAEGAWQTARGSLAVAMGFGVGEQIEVAPISAAFPAIEPRSTDEEWIAQARREHPRTKAIRADVLSLKSRLDSVRADTKGNVSLSLGASATKDLSSTGGKFQPSLGGSLVASIPLFDQSQQQARETQALAQIASRESAVEQAERDIEAELWRSIKTLETEAQNLRAAKMLFYSATQGYRIAFGRYKAGVGSIVELLGTQSSLAGARAQVTQAQLAHAQARLGLEVASGRVVITK